MAKGHSLFIADLHLSEQRPDITAAFLLFLQQKAVDADALYILGDLFEVWIGDDNPSPLLTEVATAIKALTAQFCARVFLPWQPRLFTRKKIC